MTVAAPQRHQAANEPDELVLSHGPGHSVAADREYDAATSESVSYFTEASKPPIVFADGRKLDPGGGLVGGELAAFGVLTIDGSTRALIAQVFFNLSVRSQTIRSGASALIQLLYRASRCWGHDPELPIRASKTAP